SVRKARIQAGMSQRELARRMGVGVSSISSIEAGRVPRRASLRRLLQHLPTLSLHDVLGVRRALPIASAASVWRATWADAVARAEGVEVGGGDGGFVTRVTGAHARVSGLETSLLTAARAICVGAAV